MAQSIEEAAKTRANEKGRERERKVKRSKGGEWIRRVDRFLYGVEAQKRRETRVSEGDHSRRECRLNERRISKKETE